MTLDIKEFQSTHPYGMWREPCGANITKIEVSIHTSLRDVTVPFVDIRSQMRVSIHTSLRDVTIPFIQLLTFSFCFNPHIPTGCDVTGYAQSFSAAQFQSTHPYGMWLVLRMIIYYELHRFNPHIPTGCDLIRRLGLDETLWFQSTHPYGMWLARRILFTQPG